MKYDYDLRWNRIGAIGFLLLNLGVAGWNGYYGSWNVTVAALIWAGNCWMWLGMIRGSQRTRDQARIIEAGLHAAALGRFDE